jgi:lipoic acid synthetase
MILGEQCTRHCTFCAVDACVAPLPEADPAEPLRVGHAAAQLGLSHVVVTSVTRDDLPDQGAGQFSKTIHAIRDQCPAASIEVLTPDFGGDLSLLSVVLAAEPHVFNHNVETAPRLYSHVRPQADYARSLAVLHAAAERGQGGLRVKSGLMVGLGETTEEVHQVLEDLRQAGVDTVTIGQYLRPSRKHTPVVAYIHPDQFEAYRQYGESLGLRAVFSGPLVRSSYRAAEVFGAGATAQNGSYSLE